MRVNLWIALIVSTFLSLPVRTSLGVGLRFNSDAVSPTHVETARVSTNRRRSIVQRERRGRRRKRRVPPPVSEQNLSPAAGQEQQKLATPTNAPPPYKAPPVDSGDIGGSPIDPGDIGGSPVAKLTGTYLLDPSLSDNPNAVTRRAVRKVAYQKRWRVRDQLVRRLEAPEMLAIERNGSSVTIASSRAPQTTFDVTGVGQREQLPNGGYSRVTTELNGDRLTVRSAGDPATDFTVTFDPIEGGKRLRVTRRIRNNALGLNSVVVRSVYERTSDVAQWDIYKGSPDSYDQTASVRGGGGYIIPDNQMLKAKLEINLSTKIANVGDRFTMTVTSPSQYEGATIEGMVASVSRSGRITGRSEMSLNFDKIRLRDGRTYQYAGFIEEVRTSNGEIVQVDKEDTMGDSNQTTTAQRTAIGTAVGQIIGAIAGGGKGASIGAIIGAGAGSVYVQGRDDLELMRGTEVNIRSSAPKR